MDGPTSIEQSEGSTPQDRERAKGLVTHLHSAGFQLFQEYELDVSRSAGTIGKAHVRSNENDPYFEPENDKYERIFGNYNIPKIDGGAGYDLPFGHLFMQHYTKDGLYIVEGAGMITRDRGGRRDYSNLTLRFDYQGAMENFLTWLGQDPTSALSNVFDRAMNEYDEHDSLVTDNLPPLYAKRNGLTNPFSTQLQGVTVRELATAPETWRLRKEPRAWYRHLIPGRRNK